MHNDALIPELEVVTAETQAAKDRVATVEKTLGPGPVYQGVSKTIRRLTATGKGHTDLEQKVDPDEHAGLIALARATARTVDKMTGHNLTGWHANGRDLAPLVEQLHEILKALGGDTDAADPLVAWLNDEDAPKESVAP